MTKIMYKLEINRGEYNQERWEDDCLGDNTSGIKGELESVIPELAQIIGCPETDFRVIEIQL